MNRSVFIACLMATLFIHTAFASLDRITIEVWCELESLNEPVVNEHALSDKEIATRVLEEARVVISAMLYGYSFVYTPSDVKRNVKESFTLNPVSEITWGDKNLVIDHSEVIDKKLIATVSYRLTDAQAAWVSSWSSAAIPDSGGTGEGDYFKGYSEKLTALKNSIKQAIRNHLTKDLFNKPREIKGDVLLSKYPRTNVRAGKYVTTSDIRLKIRDILPYKVF
jgi:hypothetical protein